MFDPVQFPKEILGFSFTEYLTIFISFVYAFVVAEYFIALGRILRERKRVIFYWEYLLWMVMLLLTFIVMWYINWLRLEYIHQSLGQFFLLFIPPFLFFLMVSLFFPAFDTAEPIDLRSHFLANVRMLFIIMSIYLATSIMFELLMPTESQHLAIATQAGYLLLSIVYIFFEKKALRIFILVLYLLQIIAVFNHI